LLAALGNAPAEEDATVLLADVLDDGVAEEDAELLTGRQRSPAQ
jgi:hypothetical protein